MYTVERLVDNKWEYVTGFRRFDDALVYARSRLEPLFRDIGSRVIEDGHILVTFEKGV